MQTDSELLGPATDLRASLVQQGIILLEAEGPEALTFRALGTRTGTSHSAPLVHFGDRTGLLAAIASRGFDLLLEALQGVPGPPGPGRLRALASTYVRFAVQRRALHRVMHHPALGSANRGGEAATGPARERQVQVAAWIAEARRGRDRCFAEFRQAAEAAHRAGLMPGAPNVLAARAVTALADGYILQTTDERVGGARPVDRLVAEFDAMLGLVVG